MTTGTVLSKFENLGGVSVQQGPFGPNNYASSGFDNGTPGDGQLAQIGGNESHNAAVIEFDFIPNGNHVSFRYVFGSEEYPEYVGQSVNDAFGFFITGPGIQGTKNIAQIPGSTTPVSINTVNAHSNAQYFISNGTGSTGWQASSNKVVQYDGFTSPLTAESNVQCGKMYHIKIAISDIGDEIVDSGVFLEAASFKSPPAVFIKDEIQYSGIYNSHNQLYEGCSGAEITVRRNHLIDKDQTYTVEYIGKAVRGSDYNNAPNKLLFNAGQSESKIDLSTKSDDIVEGVEDLGVVVHFKDYCDQNATDTIFLNIVESDQLKVELEDEKEQHCRGKKVHLGSMVTGGIPEYNYLWSTGETSKTIAVDALQTTVYHIQVSDQCGQFVARDSIKVKVVHYPPLVVDAGVDTSVRCPNNPVKLRATVTGGAGGYDYEWNSGETTRTILAQTMYSKVFSVSATDICGLVAKDSVNVQVEIFPLQTTVMRDTLICPFDTISIWANAQGGAGQFLFDWNTGKTGHQIEVNPSQTTEYIVTVSDSCQTYFVLDTVEVEVSSPKAGFEILTDPLITNFPIYFENTTLNGFSYDWDFDNGFSSTEEDPNTVFLDSGVHSVQLIATNEIGCVNTIVKQINVKPEFWVYIPNSFTPNNDGVNDLFRAEGINMFDVEIFIFDRWGSNLIYQSSEVSRGWNGILSNGQVAPIGTYPYKIKVHDAHGEQFIYEGYVNLIR